jgi:hypothetical protein
LFVICVLSVFARLYVRIGVQKQFTIDDGFLLLGLCFMIIGFCLLFTYIDGMYLAQAFILVGPSIVVSAPPNFLTIVFDYQKMALVSLCSTWCVIICVKMSFLLFFRKLIDKMPPLILYWRITLGVNIIVSVYGFAVYLVACPYFYSLKASE